MAGRMGRLRRGGGIGAHEPEDAMRRSTRSRKEERSIVRDC